MNDHVMSEHASARAQQRSIPPLIIDWLIEYGSSSRDKRGAEVRYFDHAARRTLSRNFGHQIVDRLGPLMDAYVVVSTAGTIITLGHRFKRIPRH